MEPKGRRQDPQAGSSKPPRVDRCRRSLGAAGLVTLVFLGIAGPFAGRAIAKPFLPISVGDTWNYEASGNRLAQVRITDSFQYRDRMIYRVRGYLFGFSDADVLFFTDRNGNLAELNPAALAVGDAGGDLDAENPAVPLVSGVWYPWSDLERRVEIPMFANDCIHGTSGRMKNGEPISVPAGEFGNALTIRYETHPCSDQDLISESFAPGIGLVARNVATFVGEERWALTSAIVGGQPIGVLNDNGRLHVVVAHDADAARGAAVAAGGVAAGGIAGRGADGAPGREATTWGAIKATFAR